MSIDLILPSQDLKGVFEVVEFNLNTALWIMRNAIEALQADPVKGAKEVQEAARQVQKAMQSLLDEQAKIIATRSDWEAGRPVDTFDLDAARAEIERILDRIRIAGGSGDIPSGA